MKTSSQFSCARTVFSAVLLLGSLAVCRVAHGQDDLFAAINGASGDAGAGFINEYPSETTPTTFASGLNRPRGITFDQGGDLYVATNTFSSDTGLAQAAIVEFSSGGGSSTFGSGDSNFVIEGLAIDSAGNIFAAAQNEGDPNFATTIYKFAPNGTRTTFGSIPGQGFGLAFDASGNLYVPDGTDNMIYKFAPNGAQSVLVGPGAFSGGGPIGLAFDSSGNLFVSTNNATNANDTILKFTPGGTETTFATGLTGPRGLAFDSTGNLFAAEVPSNMAGNILEFAPNGMETVFDSNLGVASGNGGAEFLAFESVPEPATWVASGLVVTLLATRFVRGRKS